MRKRLVRVLIACVLMSFGEGIARSGYAQANLKDDYDKLKKQYDLLVADRDNILAQTKTLLEYKNKYRELEIGNKKATEEKGKAQIDLQIAQEQLSGLQQKVSDLETLTAHQTQENKDLKNSLEKMAIEYKIVPETRKEMQALKNETTSAKRNLQLSDNKVKQLSQQKINDDAQMEIYRMQIKDLKKKYEQAMVRNRMLEKKTEQLPQRFAEIARENKALIKETALMHYNLGVFYTKNKEYARAVAEFEKAAELNPEDAAAFYNLGYIQAEYLVNRPKAIEYFRKYLSLVKTEDKDVDWVKKYILTWQTWEGKKPID